MTHAIDAADFGSRPDQDLRPRRRDAGRVMERALRGVTLDVHAGGVRRADRAVRLRQVDVHAPARLPRSADVGRVLPQRPGRLGARQARAVARAQHARSASCSRASTCCRARRRSRTSSCRCSTRGAQQREGAPRARGRGADARSASASGSAIIRISCPADSSSASRLRARWSTTRSCCSPTSRPATSTRARASR